MTTDDTLLASLQRISRGSALWREALSAVARAGRQVLVTTPSDVGITDNQGRKISNADILAEAVPVSSAGSEISSVIIVVNVPYLRQMHYDRLLVPRDFEADLDRILVHEVYGHAIPYLLAGNLSGRCPDPESDQSVAEACSIRRENAVRAELGLGHRADRGLYSLRLAMGSR